MIALLNGGQREQFFKLIGEDLAPSVLAELDDHTQAWIAERLDP
jgi:Mg/Co/Ni transporter MgtE